MQPKYESEVEKLGKVYLQRQFRLFERMFFKLKSASTALMVFLIILALIMQVVIYEVGLIPSQYYVVLGGKDVEGFKNLSVYAMEMIILNALLKSLLTYFSRLLYIIWRKNLCNYFHVRYFSLNNYYAVNVMDTKMDNIDQRLTRDVDKQCYEWSLLVSKIVVIPFSIAYYSYQCFITTTYLGPLSIYIYFICGSIVNRLLMVPVVRKTIEQEKCEGDFRFQHLQVRANAESIAFYNSKENEYYKTRKILSKLLLTQKSLFGWSYWLNSSVNVFDYVGGILSYLIIAIPIFGGKYDDLTAEELSALISKTAFVCIYLIYSFSQMFDMMRIISDIAGHTHRLGELLEQLEDNKSDNNGAMKNYLNEQENDFQMGLKNVNIKTPTNQVLLQNITLNINIGQSVLITGKTGCGKTSLLRILRGLWLPSSGEVVQCSQSQQVFYCPQRSLFTSGTLRQLLVYPSLHGFREYQLSSDLFKIENIIQELKMEKLIERLGGLECYDNNWSNSLSPGEMQQITFVRMFYHSPKIAIMDEPTSAVDSITEERLLNSCKKREITMVTVGHSESLKKFHTIELHLLGNGLWTMSPINNMTL